MPSPSLPAACTGAPNETPDSPLLTCNGALLAELSAIVGANHVLSTGELDAYTVDWRRRYQGRAAAVVLPADAQQVAAVVQACARRHVGMVPQGGNTGLVGGSVPDGSGRQVVINLRRLNRIRRVDPLDATLVAEAGCTLLQVQQAAAEVGLLFPLSLASEGSCTIGGNLASNAGGTQVLRYGTARELCLGLEVVTPAGEIWPGLAGLRKDNTGYDLRDLFIGSEGTLGLITAATLRLYPAPRSRLTVWVALPDLPAACTLLQHARQDLDAGLTAFEVMNRQAIDLVRRHFAQPAPPLPPAPWSVLLEVSDPGEPEPLCSRLTRWLEGLPSQRVSGQGEPLVLDAVLAHSLEQAHAMWQVRERIPLAQAAEGLNVKHDIGLPVSRLTDFVAATDAELRQRYPGVQLVTFGHLGDGNLHYNVQAPAGQDPATFLRDHEAPINRVVYDAVQAYGGSIAAEHGIGQLKREELAWRKDAVALRLMRAIKQAWDPAGLMNPGRVL